MSTFAAVMTGKGTGAIATVQIFGDTARDILEEIFKPAASRRLKFKTGNILLGTITDGDETIDQVTIGCEGPETFAINCHGNPLIVEMIMQLLGRRGAKLLSSRDLLTRFLTAQKLPNTIAVEAKLTQLNARTLRGTKIIASQINGGLAKKASDWLDNVNTTPLEQIAAEAEQILRDSRPAKLIIAGCTIALAGPPNSGKSTLLNYLAGRQKAIVTDIEGTTRDWVSARCQIGPLSLTLIDTAGLDEKLAATSGSSVEKAAQETARRIMAEAELILLVLDNNRPADQLDRMLLEKIAGKLVPSTSSGQALSQAEGKVLTVLNKSDLPARFDPGKLPEDFSNTVQISAKFGTGIKTLKEKVLQITGVPDFDPKTAVPFTTRQENLLQQLTNAKSKPQAASIITELLNGKV